MSSHYLDFSSCGIVPGFCKSGHTFPVKQKQDYKMLGAFKQTNTIDGYRFCKMLNDILY